MTSKMINNFKLKVLGAIAFIMIVIGISEAFSQASNIYRMQSLFLYNFTKHVKWEDNTGGNFTIGIYGNGSALEEIKKNLGSKMVWGKSITIIEIKSASEASNCHIAYIPKSNKKKAIELIGSVNPQNTLVVTEDDLMGDGAAISFVFVQQKMNFKISKEKIEQSGLKVSSSLISIGIPV